MRTVDHLRDRLRRDALVVRMGFAGGARVWWIEHPYEEFDDATMRAASVGHNGAPLLVEAGDCLFGWEGNSQTWRSAYGE
ncbi:hypothetical protein [Mesorhizobium sp.]|uniref:hypothetical protein n=1 Tax=Mesorhizobium sp. TaxID=1871066 RepID=UPI000FE4D67E|nr:hypothetical protein [Mesorhizobium sp.]RWK12513.1 MAG: hypothetical protein EOR39_02630 [Mesorhizobium sp.]